MDNEKLKYAEECLDLIDILRQEKGSVGARTERMEEVARKYIEDLEKAETQKSVAAESGAGKVADSTSDPGEGSNKGKTEPEPAASVVMPWTPISTGGEDDDEVKKTPDDTFQIEGYLRDPALHKPREQ